MTARLRNQPRKRRGGMAYVAVLVLVLVITTLGLSLLFTVRTQQAAATGRLEAVQAAYLAESAAQHAAWRLLHEGDDSVTRFITQGQDDAEQDEAGAEADIGNSEIRLGKMRHVGFRFQNIMLTRAGTVTAARVQFVASSDDDKPTKLVICGEAHDNAPQFQPQVNNLSSRAKTTASVAWDSPPTWKKGNLYETPDLSFIIREIINRPGWVSGNSIVLLFRSADLNGERRAYARDDAGHTPAMLTVLSGRQEPMSAASYTMHSLAGGRYGYKVRRPTATTFGTIATVGAIGEAVARQSYVLHIRLPRRPIDISNPGPHLTDYQVLVPLTTDKLGTPYADIDEAGGNIRFVDANGADLSYWIETWNAMGTSTVWVRVPEIPPGSSTIYMTYHESGTPGAASGTDTFLFYDDFEDHEEGQAPDGWSPPGFRVKKDGDFKVLDDKDEMKGTLVYAETDDFTDVAVRQRFKSASGKINLAGLIARRLNSGHALYAGVSKIDISGFPSPVAQAYHIRDGNWDQIGTDWLIDDVTSGWHVQELAIDGDVLDVRLNGRLVGSATVPAAASATGTTGFYSQDDERAYRDWQLLRRYRRPEPTAAIR